MGVLASRLDPSSDAYVANRAANLELVTELDRLLEQARAGGGPKYVDRHLARGKLLARERVELLLDRDGPFLELSPLAAWGTDFPVGASGVTGVGPVAGVECVVTASDPTVRGGATNPYGLRKTLRAMEIAERNRLPLVQLIESSGADLPTQSQIFIPGGAVFRNLTRLSRAGVPTVALVFGSSTAGGAGVSGLADQLADDEHDCIRLVRQVIADLGWRKLGPGPTRPADEPVHDPEELLGLAPVDLKVPAEVREILARVVDGSRFSEWKPLYGTSLCCGWASVHGYPVGILANAGGVLFSEESNKAAHFIQLANQSSTPLLFLQNTTGYMVGKSYEQRGIIKDGAKMINAVANSAVPHVTLILGASYGAGGYGIARRASDPRFLFTSPPFQSAATGPEQLAGVMSILARQSAQAGGRPLDEAADRAARPAGEGEGGAGGRPPPGGPPPAASSPRADAILAAARRTGADAVHPGYGFLSEQPAIAEAFLDAGLRWVGPPPKVLAALGDKLEARRVASEAGGPGLPAGPPPRAPGPARPPAAAGGGDGLP